MRPLQVFNTLTNSGASTSLDNDYVLPAATLTWRFTDDMQVRFNASKTIARPQFRELMFQSYFDPETNRRYRGNPLLIDSEFVNAEGALRVVFRLRSSVCRLAGVLQEDRPAHRSVHRLRRQHAGDELRQRARGRRSTAPSSSCRSTSRSTAISDGGFFGSRRAVVIGNYTYTDSKFNVGPNDTVSVYGTSTQPASNFFRDGSQLTGQSDHLVNLQLGLEQTGRLSQQTILLSYASDRVTSRGASGLPDIYESPGLRVDIVLRQGLTLLPAGPRSQTGSAQYLRRRLRGVPGARREHRVLQQVRHRNLVRRIDNHEFLIDRYWYGRPLRTCLLNRSWSSKTSVQSAR